MSWTQPNEEQASRQLAKKNCRPCDEGLTPLSPGETNQLLKNLNGWTSDERSIFRDFSFKSFVEGLAFVNKVGEIAEREGHHPDIFLHQYNKVRVTSWTHVVSGLTENDFILAAKIDSLF